MSVSKRDLHKSLPISLPSSLQFFSVAEVAIILGTSTKLIHEWVQDGILPSFRLGPHNRLIRIRQQDLEKFIDNNIRTGTLKTKEPETEFFSSPL